MLKCQKMFATCGGDTPRNPPTGTIPPCFNPLGVDTYVSIYDVYD